MKKSLSAVLMLCMLVSVFVPTVYASDLSNVDAPAVNDCLTFEISSSFENNILTVFIETVCVYGETSCVDILYDGISAKFVYDSSVLTLRNTFTEGGALDCIATAPDDTWENLSTPCDDGIYLRACTAVGGPISNETPLVFELQFDFAPDAKSTYIEIPDDTIEVIDHDMRYRNSIGAELTILFPEPDAPVLCGDVNGDGKINGKDATRLLSYLADYNYQDGTSTIEITLGADCNGDGVVDGRDSVRLLRYLSSVDPETGVSDVVLGA